MLVKEDIKAGMKLAFLQDGVPIDRVLIHSIGQKGTPPKTEIMAESLHFQPGNKFELFLINESGCAWLALHEGPSGERCFSERGPTYSFKFNR